MERIITKLPSAMPEMPVLKNVAAYTRVSSNKDAMLHSLSAQVSHYSGLIQTTPGWAYVGVYCEEGRSGTLESRPEFQRLLTDCRAGKIDLILVKSISRLARNTVTFLATVRELKALGVDIWFENERISAMSATGELMMTLVAGFMQEESRAVSENCKWRIRQQYREGKPALHNAYGYRSVNGKPVIDTDEARVIRFIFDSHNEGCGLATIAKLLDGLRVKAPSTKAWNALTIRYILSNERYVGDLVLQKTFITDHLTKRKVVNRGELDQVLVTDGFPAIVSREAFERAQRLSAEHSGKYTPDGVNEMSALYAGKIICKRCGKPYKRKVAHGKAAWNCGTFMRKGKAVCHGKQIPEDVLLAVTSEVLQAADHVPDSLEPIRRIVVPAPNQLMFEMTDGSTFEREWRDHSRSDCWDETARARAAEQTRERRAK